MINATNKKTQPVQYHVNKMKALLEMERQAEIEESEALLSQYSFKELEKRNLALTKLFINHVSTGIYGRMLLHLGRKGEKNGLKDKDEKAAGEREEGAKVRKFSPGDIVGIFQSSG